MKPWALVIRLGGVGDNFIASSVLPLLAEKYNVEVMAQEPWHVVFENNPYIAKLTVKKKDDLPQGGGLEWQKFFETKGKDHDFWVHFSHSCEYSLALLPDQTQFYWSKTWRRANCGKNYLEWVHDIAGLPHTFDVGPRFYPTQDEMDRAWETKKKFGPRVVGIVLCGTRIDKVWPFLPQLVAKVIREMHLPVVLFGAPGREFEIGNRIKDYLEAHNGSFAGMWTAISMDPEQKEWPLRRSLAQLRTCDVILGPDTGPMWSVAMEDVPKIVLLSHASPDNITKHWHNTISLHADQERVDCWPCHQLHNSTSTCRQSEKAEAAACISDISDETVLHHIRVALPPEPAIRRRKRKRSVAPTMEEALT